MPPQGKCPRCGDGGQNKKITHPPGARADLSLPFRRRAGCRMTEPRGRRSMVYTQANGLAAHHRHHHGGLRLSGPERPDGARHQVPQHRPLRRRNADAWLCLRRRRHRGGSLAPHRRSARRTRRLLLLHHRGRHVHHVGGLRRQVGPGPADGELGSRSATHARLQLRQRDEPQLRGDGHTRRHHRGQRLQGPGLGRERRSPVPAGTQDRRHPAGCALQFRRACPAREALGAPHRLLRPGLRLAGADDRRRGAICPTR